MNKPSASRSLTTLGVLLVSAIFTLPSAHATNFVWDATANGAWTTPTNWDLDSGYPNASTDNVTGNTSIFLPTVTGSITVGTFTPTSYSTSRGWSVVMDSGGSSLTATTVTVQSSLKATGSNLVQLNIYDNTLGNGGTLDIGTLNVTADNGAAEFSTTNNTSGGQWSRGIGRVTIQNTNLAATAANVTVRLGQTSLDSGTTADPGTKLGLVTFSGTFNRTITLIQSTGASAGYTETVQVSGLNDAVGVGGTTTINGGAAAATYTNNATLKVEVGTGNSYTTSAILADGTSTGTNQLSVLKTGAGTQKLTGASTYTGGTTVSAGTLLVSNTSGSGLGTGAVIVNGGKLGGSGAFSGPVTVNAGGTLAAGESIESLGTGSIAFAGGTFEFELNTTAGTADLVYGGDNSTLSLSGSSILSLIDLGAGSTLASGTKFTLISYDGAWNGGVFSGFADDSTFTFANNTWRIDYNDTVAGSNFNADATLNGTAFVTLTVVPEPGTWALASLGLGALLVMRRRRAVF